MKVAISGSHGTGKSTLLRGVKSVVDREWGVVEEVPRALCDRVGEPDFLQRGNNSLLRQLLLVARQIADEGRMATRRVLSDRSVVDHWAYTLAIIDPSDHELPEVRETRLLVEEWIPTYDRIFYLPIEFPLAVDGVREDDQQFQADIDQSLRSEYERLGVEVVELRGSVDQRESELSTWLKEGASC
jgi:predicted ATPase